MAGMPTERASEDSRQVVAVHSPQDVAPGREVTLSRDGQKLRVWRKQILPLGQINYEGRQIRFDADYHRQLVRSFRDGAYDSVPFQLADSNNSHNNDPERTTGELVDLRAEPSGLYGYFQLSNPAAVKRNPKLGVSCRIIENYTREHDGKPFGHSIQHVLGTLDPRITGMKPWEQVELASGPVDSTVDLSAGTYADLQTGSSTVTTANEEKVVVELSTAQLGRLTRMLDEDAAVDDLDPALLEDGDEGEQDEIDELDDGDELETETGGDESVALAAVQTLQRQVLELTNQLNNKDAEHEIAQLAATGLAPSIIEAARPLLALGSGVIELSNGGTVSPSGQVRKLLREILELSNRGYAVVGLDQELGGYGAVDQLESTRKEMLAQLSKDYGN